MSVCNNFEARKEETFGKGGGRVISLVVDSEVGGRLIGVGWRSASWEYNGEKGGLRRDEGALHVWCGFFMKFWEIIAGVEKEKPEKIDCSLWKFEGLH